MFPLVGKINTFAVNQDSEEPSVKNRANESLTWMRLGDCPQDGSRGSRTALHDFSSLAAFMSIIAFESSGLSMGLANANMERNSEKISCEVTR